jgi:SEC-C motif-containing protein
VYSTQVSRRHPGAADAIPLQRLRAGIGRISGTQLAPGLSERADAADLSSTDTRWDGLEILTSQGGPDDTLGMVEFKAWFMKGTNVTASMSDPLRAPSGALGLHRRRAGSGAAAGGRNDPCPCGSGKKFKKCCG